MKKHIIYECGICGCYHPWDFNGDCRDDTNRFDTIEDYVAAQGLASHMHEIDPEVRCMCDRIEADGGIGVPCPICGRTES